MIYQQSKLHAPADFDEDSPRRETIKRPIATYGRRWLPDLAATRFRPFEQQIDGFSRGLHEADMIGIAANRNGIGTAEFLDRPADDKFKPGIIAKDGKAIGAPRFHLRQAENGNKKIPGRSDIGNMQIQVVQSHDSSKRLSRGDMSVDPAHVNARHSTTMAKFRVAGSHHQWQGAVLPYWKELGLPKPTLPFSTRFC